LFAGLIVIILQGSPRIAHNPEWIEAGEDVPVSTDLVGQILALRKFLKHFRFIA
jgi:hypothetical protein